MTFKEWWENNKRFLYATAKSRVDVREKRGENVGATLIEACGTIKNLVLIFGDYQMEMFHSYADKIDDCGFMIMLSVEEES